MRLTFLLIFSIFMSMPVLAEKNWLEQFIRSKSYKCSMDEEQFNQQMLYHLDNNIQLLKAALKSRNSSLEDVAEDRASVDVGVFSKSSDYDFSIFEKVVVGAQGFRFPVRTTYYVKGQPTVKAGLWFPLKVKDTGSKKTCTLQRILVRDGQQVQRPDVDLTLSLGDGKPLRVMIERVIEVVDTSSDQEPVTTAMAPSTVPVTPPPPAAPEVPVAQAPAAPAAQEEPAQATEDDLKQEREEKQRKSRGESRKERRERRRRERREERTPPHRRGARRRTSVACRREWLFDCGATGRQGGGWPGQCRAPQSRRSSRS